MDFYSLKTFCWSLLVSVWTASLMCVWPSWYYETCVCIKTVLLLSWGPTAAAVTHTEQMGSRDAKTVLTGKPGQRSRRQRHIQLLRECHLQWRLFLKKLSADSLDGDNNWGSSKALVLWMHKHLVNKWKCRVMWPGVFTYPHTGVKLWLLPQLTQWMTLNQWILIESPSSDHVSSHAQIYNLCSGLWDHFVIYFWCTNFSSSRVSTRSNSLHSSSLYSML